MKKYEKISFEQIVSELLDNENPFPPVYLHRFSDLDPKQVKVLRDAWPRVDAERRYNLIRDLDELASAETVVMFTDAAEIALDDSEAKTRAAAIDLLTSLEDTGNALRMVKLLTKDPNEMVREHAAIALGFYMYLYALEEIEPKTGDLVKEAVLNTFKSQDALSVRRRCLEALGYSDHKEVDDILERAFHSNDAEWVASSLFAMGRSAQIHWQDHILEALERHESEIVLEAVRAAGELNLSDAEPALIHLIEDENVPGEAVFYATIWALSQIGGKNARETLEKLGEKAEEESDDELLSFIEDALENLDFNEDMDAGLDMLEMDLAEMAGGRVVDLENLPDDFDEDDDAPKTKDNGDSPAKKKRKSH